MNTRQSKNEPQTEQEWPDYYQAHKDEAELWGESVPPPRKPRGRPSRNMDARISVRFTPEEMQGIRAKSQEDGITHSEVVRRAVQELSRRTARG